MTKPTNVVARQTDWRVDQRESRRGYQHHETVKKWASILNFIVAYQNRHGFAPMNHAIVRDTNLSIAQVQYHLEKMHDQCLIHDHGNTHPRAIDMLQGGKLLTGGEPEEAPAAEQEKYRTFETTGKDGAAVAKRKDDNTVTKHSLANDPEKMKAVAKVIAEHTDIYGKPPNGQVIADEVGLSNSTISRLTSTMVALGYIDRAKGEHSNWLTSLGRRKMLGYGDEEAQEAVETEEYPTASLQRIRADRNSQRIAAPASPNLQSADTLSLVIELNRRGYRINM